MKFRLHLDIHTGLTAGLWEREREMTSEWAEQAAQRVKRLNKDAQIKAGLVIEKRKLLEEQGAPLWVDLRKTVERMVEEFNEAFGSKALIFTRGSGRIDVNFVASPKNRELSVEFSSTSAPDALRWDLRGDASASGQCSLQVDDAGQVHFALGDRPISPASLATQLLERLIP